jgi:hypothetical protein
MRVPNIPKIIDACMNRVGLGSVNNLKSPFLVSSNYKEGYLCQGRIHQLTVFVVWRMGARVEEGASGSISRGEFKILEIIC